MKTGIFFAVVLHVGIILFGGLLFQSHREDKGVLRAVDLLANEDVKEDEKKKEEPKKEETQAKAEEIEASREAPPDAAEVVRNIERSAAADAPALAAVSLSAIEAALSGQGGGGGGDFAQALDFASGGRIGGMGRPGTALEDKVEQAFSMAEIDQKPRVIFQTSPVYPAEMRGKKVEGVVSVIFIVSPEGKVTNQRVEKSSHAAFEKPALDAVRQWKFEPGLKAGQRVACKMRVSIRFQRS